VETQTGGSGPREPWYYSGRKVTAAVALGVFVIVLLATIPLYTDITPADKVGLSYGGGPFEGRKFQGVYQPGYARFINGWGDRLFLYPVTQRNYIVSKTEGEGDRSGVDFIQATSKDSIPIDFEIAIYFKLNADLLRQFHEQLGLKYQAWDDHGWDRLLNDYIRQQVEESLQSEARRYSAEALYADQATLETLSKELGPVINRRIIGKAGGNYFCNPDWSAGQECGDFTFTIKKADIANEAVKAAFAARRESEIAIETERNKVEQAQQQARAIRTLKSALRAGNSYLYVLWEAIKSGVVDFWVLPSDGKLTLQTPSRSSE